MRYAKVAHSVLTDPRVESLSDAEFGLLVRLTVWCSEQESDGRFTVDSVRRRCIRRGSLKSLQGLLDVGLVHVEGSLDVNSESAHGQFNVDSVSAGGRLYVISEYLETNTAASAIQEKRAKEREKKQASRSPCPQGTRRGPSTENRDTEIQRTETQSTEPPKPPKVARRKLSKPLPDDWEPQRRHILDAVGRDADVDLEAQSFRNHALANDRRCVDWDRAFDNWLLKARPRPVAASRGAGGTFDPFARVKMLEEEERREKQLS